MTVACRATEPHESPNLWSVVTALICCMRMHCCRVLTRMASPSQAHCQPELPVASSALHPCTASSCPELWLLLRRHCNSPAWPPARAYTSQTWWPLDWPWIPVNACVALCSAY